MKILLLTTQPTWKSWDTKLMACRGGLGLAKNIGEVTIDKKEYTHGKPPVVEGKIDRAWYNTLSIKYKKEGYDALVIHCSEKEAKAWKMQDGLRGSTINDEVFGEMWLCADENTVVTYDDGRKVNRFVKVFIHECSHWVAKRLLGQEDKTHYWDYERHAIYLAFTTYTFPVGLMERLRQSVTKERLSLPITNWNSVSQHFGKPDKAYVSGIHPGTDFAVPVGTPVIAPTDGKITKVWDKHKELGNACLFEFYHKGKLYTLQFAHLKSAPKLGGFRRDTTMAQTGNTGKSTGPHCHVALWQGGYNADVLVRADLIREVMLDPYVFFITNKY